MLLAPEGRGEGITSNQATFLSKMKRGKKNKHGYEKGRESCSGRTRLSFLRGKERKQVGAREDRRRNGSKGEGNEGNSLVTGGGVSPFLLENA